MNSINNTIIPVPLVSESFNTQVTPAETANTAGQALAPVEPANEASRNQAGDQQTAQQQQQQRQQEIQQIRQLSARDREVRNHEAAHVAVGGQYAGAASFTYQRGPNGVNYAIAGEVPIRLPTAGEPRQVLQAAEQVRRAALAPAEPSAQDRSVAAQASAIAARARTELAALAAEQRRSDQATSAESATAEPGGRIDQRV